MSDQASAERLPLPLRVARALGLGRGRFRGRAVGVRPQRTLELYSFEDCSACRRVRRVLTELDLDYVHRTCPMGASDNRRRLRELSGKVQVPFLIDPNCGARLLDSRRIVRHLREHYGSG